VTRRRLRVFIVSKSRKPSIAGRLGAPGLDAVKTLMALMS
jgi:hypothetical protein